MLTVRVYDDYNLIALQDLDTDDIERCEFSTKSRAETSRDMENLNGLCQTLKSSKLLEKFVENSRHSWSLVSNA